MKVERLSADPEILVVRDFISESEAAHLMGVADGHFEGSRTVCENPQGCVTEFRTSSSAHLKGDAVTQAISKRGLDLAKLNFAEDLQVVRYFKGQEFKPHLDAFDTSEAGRLELRKFGGRQRDATFLIYLNEPTLGGSTKFTKLGLEVSPQAGSAIFWRNTLSDGSVDQRTEHAGMPVVEGVKYAVNLWLRGQKTLGEVAPQDQEKKMAGEVVWLPEGPKAVGRSFSAEEDGRRFGMKIDRRKYSGTPHTLNRMAALIREGSTSPAMRQFAEMVVKNSGVESSHQISNEAAAQILLDYVRDNVRYRPDPNQVEYVQAASITLCIPGAQMCIPVEDCDGMVVALGSLMGAYGIPVKILKQTYAGDVESEHVLLLFESNAGRWLAADPADPDRHSVGWRAPAEKELVIDPLDPSNTGEQAQEFVGVGALVGRLPSRVVFGNLPLPQIGSDIPLLVTRGDVVVQQGVLAASAASIGNALQACTATTNPDYASAQNDWLALANDVTNFVNTGMPASWAFWVNIADVYGQGLALQQRLVAMSARITKMGCNAPIEPSLPVTQPDPASANWADAIKWGFVAATAVVGAYGVSKVIEFIPTPRREVARAAHEAKRLSKKISIRTYR
jgi:prolyl 4-hydroxylase